MTPTLRSVAGVVDGVRTLEGAGFAVRRPFPTPSLDHVDPFLLLDEMGPMDLGPGPRPPAPRLRDRDLRPDRAQFVMSTQGEIRQALLDYQSGRFGWIEA